MNSNDYVKYLTEQFVQYMNQPRTERKTIREEKKVTRGPFHYHMFGMIPYALSHFMTNVKNKRQQLFNKKNKHTH